MTVATTAIRYDGVSALLILAAGDIAAERGSAARFDGGHHFQLCVAHVAAIGMTPSGTEVAEYIYRLFCQLLFTQAFLFKQLRLFERIAERAIVRAAVKVRPAIV